MFEAGYIECVGPRLAIDDDLIGVVSIFVICLIILARYNLIVDTHNTGISKLSWISRSGKLISFLPIRITFIVGQRLIAAR